MNGRYLIALLVVSLLLLNCSASKFISKQNPESQASVIINLKNGAQKKGIIFKGDSKELIYIDAEKQSGTPDTLSVGEISLIRRAANYYDFQGKTIPLKEIRARQKRSRTFLYGAAGFVLGSAVGTGVSLVLFSPKKEGDTGNSGAAIATIAGLGVAGGWLFGSMGASADFDDAVFAARKVRGQKVSERLRELEKQKAALEKKTGNK